MADVINMAPQAGPQFDPKKKYTWDPSSTFTLSGAEFGFILNTFRSILGTPEAQNIMRTIDAAEIVEGLLIKAVESGSAVEVQDNPKNSL